MINKILLATTNKGKVAEFKTIIKDVEFFTLTDFQNLEPPKEIGESFEENAKIKADFYFKNFNLPVVVEDSGFCVEKLGNLPGVHSADWGKNGDFTDGIKRVYQMLKGEGSPAKFVSVIIFKTKEKEVLATGEVSGSIAEKPRGENGFGFDPCFIPNGYTKTFAEMTMEEKSSLSHRKIGISNLMKKL
jgi:XTP/dITP diphosphohydrolase